MPHTNLVYSVAPPNAGSAYAAAEITQAMFSILAKKARAVRRGRDLREA